MLCAWLMAALAFIAAAPAQAGFPNGGFESDLANWNVSHLTNPATIPTFPPTTAANLGLTADGTNRWSNAGIGLGYVYTDAVGAGSDTHTGNAVGYPLYGLKAARVNYHGNSNRASSIDQTATMTLADVDPADGKVHVRFAIAPVLQNPGHNPNEQPYFFVEVTNVTKGNTQLFYTFNFSGQSGVPWITVGGYQYTQWQAIDIAPGAGVLDVGDQVNVRIIASGCGPSGHEGHVYVDSGPALTTLPGPYVYATGPQYAAAGGTITYTYTYGNSGTSPLTNTLVTVVSPQDNTGAPQNLTFQSVSGDGGHCVTPAAGVAGTISCNFGTLNPNNVGTFQVMFNVPNPAVGPINHGNYQVSGDGSPALLGPLVQTNLTGTPLVDLGVTITDGQSSVTWGDNLTYTIVVSNAGPATVPVGATIIETLPATLTGATWTCAASAGTACPHANGNGAISEITTATIPAGDTLTYTVLAAATGSGTSTINNAVTVTAPGGVLDSSNANNTGADVDNVGTALSTLTVNKSGAGTGTVSTVPGGINCGTACPTANADYPTGSSVVLYASAPPGSIFTGWSGGGCSGAAASCTVTLAGATVVTADFAAPVTVHPVIGANCTVSPGTDQPVIPGGTTSFTVTPSAGYALQVTDDCAAGAAQTGGTLVGNTYTTNAIAQNCTINFNFTNVGVATVTPSVGAHGSITPNAAKTVLTGGSVSYVVIPDSGYTAAAIPGGTCAAGTWSGNTYTISPVNADCSVNFSFSNGYTVTGSLIGGNGTINPASVNVASGGSAAFTITPAAGYTAAIDASSTCAAGSWAGTTYTVSNVTADCAVAAIFSAALAPFAANDSATTLYNTPVTVPVSDNDSASAASSLALNSIDLDPSTAGQQTTRATGGGSFTANANGTVTFTPVSGFQGVITIPYTIKDSLGQSSNVANISITVLSSASSSVPVAQNDTGSTTLVAPVILSVLGNDSPSSGKSLVLTSVILSGTNPAQGVWVANANGTVTFTAAGGFKGTATANYTVSDSGGGTSNTATITVSVGGGALPAAQNDSASTQVNTAVTVFVLANDAPGSGHLLVPPVTLSGTTHGVWAANADGTVTFTPAAGFTGTATANYTAGDSGGGTSNTAVITVAVNPVGVAPAATNDVVPHGTRTFSPASNDTASSGAVLNPSTLDIDPVTPGVQRGPIVTAQGTWNIIDNNGTVNFAPVAGFYGTATLTYAISDSLGNTATATMSVPIDPSGVVYNSMTRLPVAGATVTLLYNGGNADALVVGGNATQATNALGQYAFFLIPGAPAVFNYSLTVSRAGYTFPSVTIPPSGSWGAGGPSTAVVGPPSGAQPTTYYLFGPLPVVDVTNNNIPLDLVVNPSASPVPTLSESMMFMLAGLLLLFGFAAMRKQVR